MLRLSWDHDTSTTKKIQNVDQRDSPTVCDLMVFQDSSSARRSVLMTFLRQQLRAQNQQRQTSQASAGDFGILARQSALPRLGLHDLLDLLIEVAVLRKLLLDMSGENCLESLVRNPLVTRIINMSKTFQESPNVGPKSNQFVENPWSKDRVTIFGYSSTIH